MIIFPYSSLRKIICDRSLFLKPYAIMPRHIEMSEFLLEYCSRYLFRGIENTYEDIKLLNSGIVSRISPDMCINGVLGQYPVALILFRKITIVFNHLERRNSEFYSLFQEVFHRYRLLIHFNLYWSPPESVGAGGHRDNHDVVIVQLSGSKCWKFENGEILLSAGDVLCVREGTFHDPVTEKNSDSIHLTIGIKGEEKFPAFRVPDYKTQEKSENYTFKFIKNISNAFSFERLSLVFNEGVMKLGDRSHIEFQHGGQSLILSNEIMDYYFESINWPYRVNVRGTQFSKDRQNIILSFLKNNIPFNIEEATYDA